MEPEPIYSDDPKIISKHVPSKVRVIPVSERTIHVYGCVDLDENHKVMCVDDEKASYMFRKEGLDENVKIPEFIDMDKVDYGLLPSNDAYKGTEYEKSGIPLSFLQIETVDEGEQWYREHTKYPECMIPLLARYQFGDLRKGVNKKAMKNARKKAARKAKKDKKKASFYITKEPSIINFD